MAATCTRLVILNRVSLFGGMEWWNSGMTMPTDHVLRQPIPTSLL